MATEARIHHYIPQCYLRGFGWNKGKNWYVHALDLEKQSFFQPNTKNICCERDFMRVEVDGHEPNIIEKELGKLEGEARQATLRVSQTRKFEGEDRNTILNLIALLAVRSPQRREHWRQFHEEVSKKVMSLTLATKQRFESQMKQMKADGYAPEHELTYEELKEFHESDRYTVEVTREFHIRQELKLHNTVLELLGHRTWRLYFAGEGQGTFVTSDQPVSLTFLRPNEVPEFHRRSPGFGLKHTEVVFPLTKDCLLHGKFYGLEEGSEEAYAGFIGACNMRMISSAFDFVFTAEKTFPYYLPPGEVYFDDRFIERAAKLYRARPNEKKVGDGTVTPEKFNPDFLPPED